MKVLRDELCELGLGDGLGMPSARKWNGKVAQKINVPADTVTQVVGKRLERDRTAIDGNDIPFGVEEEAERNREGGRIVKEGTEQVADPTRGGSGDRTGQEREFSFLDELGGGPVRITARCQ